MLHGDVVLLRARSDDDARLLHTELYEDVESWVRSDTRPWLPAVFGPGSPYWPGEEPAGPADAAVFAVAELASEELAGETLLWDVDLHNSSAHLGIALRPGFRGRGLGLDAIRVLCRYGFEIRGLHRLQLETLSDNHAMIAIASRLGFTREGTTRGSSWVNGGWADDVIFGLLDSEFASSVTAPHS